LLVFLGLRLNNILGKPEIEVSLPETTSSDTITVTGKIQPGDSLTLNNEVIYADETGRFAKEVQLEPGLNTLEFRAQRHLGRETKIIKRVYYQPVQ
jgi:sorbitol-specific phosphotransferase system component IIA